MTVPVMHSSACLLRLCLMGFSGPICVVMKTLIEKKYALPNRVIEGLFNYFYNFINESKTLPVIWH
jgi:essential nuclear protein 1